MSIVLLVVAAVLAVVTAVLYPTTQELPAPLYDQLVVASLRQIELSRATATTPFSPE